MAIELNYLPVRVLGSSDLLESSGLQVNIPSHTDDAYQIKFFVDFTSVGVTYAAGDKVSIVTSNGHRVELTKIADSSYWYLTTTSNLFGAGGLRPGETTTLVATIVYQDTGAAPAATHYSSRDFNLTIRRPLSWAPEAYSNIKVRGWWSAWDLTTSDGGAVSSWEDRSQYEMNLDQSTAGYQPTYGLDGIGRPYVRFDGTDDTLATTPKVSGVVAILAVMRCRGLSVTVNECLTIDDTNDLKVGFTLTNLVVTKVATSNNAYVLAENEWVAVGVLIDAADDLNSSLNGGTVTTTAASDALGLGTFHIGGKTAFAKVDFHEILLLSGSGLDATSIVELTERMAQYAAV